MRKHLLCLFTLLAAASAARAADAKAAPVDTAAAFSRLKSLAGEWTAEAGMKVKVTYELIAGGTVLVERETFENMPDMLTVYHTDGKRLLLTHYCSAGNQPRMEAKSYNQSTGELQFKFLDATNLVSPSTGHMHEATFRFVDDKHLVAQWDYHEKGQVKPEKIQLTRVR